MEHELFQSELKPSVDGALVSDIIRSSSSGQNSYRTAAMELLFEKSIQARRKRAFMKVEGVQPDPTLPPAMTCDAPNMSTLQMQSPTPAATEREVSEDSPTLSKTPQKVKEVTPREEPLAASSSEDFVQLVCENCNLKQLPSDLWRVIYCGYCSVLTKLVRCTGCRTFRVSHVEACTKCHKKFK